MKKEREQLQLTLSKRCTIKIITYIVSLSLTIVLFRLVFSFIYRVWVQRLIEEV